MATTAIQIDFLLSGSTLDDGTANNGGKVFFWESGGAFATNKSVYEDKGKVTEYDYVIASGSEPHTNKNYVLLDAGGKPVAEAGGRAEVYADGTYDIQIYDSSNVIVDTLLSVSYAVVPSSVRVGSRVGGAGTFTIDSDTNAYYVGTGSGNEVGTFDFDANSVSAGHNITLMIDDGANSLTITPKAGGTIGGESTWIIKAENSAVRLESDGVTNDWAIASLNNAFPSFSVDRNTSAQAITAATPTKVEFGHEVFDTNSDFDSVNYRFLPTVAGKYLLTASLYILSLDVNSEYEMSIYDKNGTEIAGLIDNNASGSARDYTPNITTVVDADGSTDYYEVWILIGTNENISGNIARTYFQGSKIS